MAQLQEDSHFADNQGEACGGKKITEEQPVGEEMGTKVTIQRPESGPQCHHKEVNYQEAQQVLIRVVGGWCCNFGDSVLGNGTSSQPVISDKVKQRHAEI